MQVLCQYSGHEFISIDKGSEIITFCKQRFSSFMVTSRFVNIPFPADIIDPENDIPRVVVPIVDTVNPAAPASPPEALLTIAPSTLN